MPEGSDRAPDVDGDVLTAKKTVELMQGTDVRVLIPYSTDVKVAVRQLKKFAKWLKRKPELIELANPEPEHEYTQGVARRGFRDFEDDLPF